MNLNEVLTKQNIITKIVLQDGEKELPKELKVKVMRVRMAYNKIKKQFDEDVQEFTTQVVPDELKELANKQERTEVEEARFNELNDKVNSEYREYVIQKGYEEITESIEDTITEDEYMELVDINSGNDSEINGVKIKAADLLEIFYEMFVK
jgi:hypothetical protein